MLQYERFQTILGLLNKQPTVKVSELSKMLGASESTIRRDITDLAEAGRLKKVFGGAVRIQQNRTVEAMDVATRSGAYTEEKKRIAKYAASLINKNDFVYIDAGTTAGAMIEYIDNKDATYITNGVRHALALAEKGCTVYTLPGKIKQITEAIVGPVVAEGMSRYNFTKCFMGVDAIDLHHGLTTPDVDEAMTKSEAISHSREVFFLADHSKFDVVSSVCFGQLAAGTILTDALPNEGYRKVADICEVKG